MMPLSFNCPNCSAPLDVEIKPATTIRCHCCNTSVIVPEELRVKSTGTSVTPDFRAAYNPPSQAEINEQVLRFKLR